MEVIENLQDIEDDEEIFESIEDIWPDYPRGMPLWRALLVYQLVSFSFTC